jgi:hypothetical protein
MYEDWRLSSHAWAVRRISDIQRTGKKPIRYSVRRGKSQNLRSNGMDRIFVPRLWMTERSPEDSIVPGMGATSTNVRIVY